MPIHDLILTYAACRNGHIRAVEVQYTYGPVTHRDLHVGDTIDWSLRGFHTYGFPGARRVRVLACVASAPTGRSTSTLDCPDCGIEYPSHVIEIENDRIATVRPVRPGEEDELLKQEYEFIVDE